MKCSERDVGGWLSSFKKSDRNTARSSRKNSTLPFLIALVALA